MSNTIQARHYAARRAALLQQRPRDLIDAVEHFAEALDGDYPHSVRVFYDFGPVANVKIVGVGSTGRGLVSALTAGAKVTLVGASLPTAAPEQLTDVDEFTATNSWSRWTGQAKEALQNGAAAARLQTSAAPRRRVERLTAIQTAFGFTILDLAAVLGITRPQLYKWLDAANDVNLQEASRARLATVERMAKEWTARSSAPLSSVSKEPLAAGGSVFELLTADVINEVAVTGAFDELVGKLQERPKSRSERLRDAGFTRRPSVRSLPSDE